MERLLLLPLALLFLHPGLQAQPTPAEMAALEDMADAFPTLNWTGPDHCHWEGGQCDINGNIIPLSLTDTNRLAATYWCLLATC